MQDSYMQFGFNDNEENEPQIGSIEGFNPEMPANHLARLTHRPDTSAYEEQYLASLEQMEDAGISYDDALAAFGITADHELAGVVKQEVDAINKFLHQAPEGRGLVDLLAGHPFAKLFRDASRQSQVPEDSVALAGLGCFSTAALMVYNVNEYGDTKTPLGLYAVIEQPSGSGKSGVVNRWRKPIDAHVDHINASRQKAISDAKNLMKATPKKEDNGQAYAAAESEMLALPRPIEFGISDATPEAVEAKACKVNHGLFTMISDEQTMLNSLLGGYDKGAAANLEVVLKGFEGGRARVLRVGRASYGGTVYGAIVGFAQSGMVDSILTASGTSGFAERFLMLSEESLIGRRNMRNTFKGDYEAYQRMVNGVFTRFPQRQGIDHLETLYFNPEGREFIDDLRDRMEAEIGATFSHPAIAGMASKAGTFAAKIAALLHISAHYATSAETAPTTIAPQWVYMACRLVEELVRRRYEMLTGIGAIGSSAELQALIDYIDKNGQMKMASGKTFRVARRATIENTLRRKPPFTGLKSVRAAIDMALEGKRLSQTPDGAQVGVAV